jgi:hypothetical protein
MGELVKQGNLGECNRAILKAKEDIGKNLFILGAALKIVRDQELYKESCETFLEYLGQPEISLARATVYKAIKCYEVFSDKYLAQVTGVDMDKLAMITGMAKKCTPEEFEEWISKARLLSRSDLRDEIRRAKGKEPKHTLSLAEKIKQFIDDDFPRERKERKAFIKEVIESWKLWENN